MEYCSQLMNSHHWLNDRWQSCLQQVRYWCPWCLWTVLLAQRDDVVSIIKIKIFVVLPLAIFMFQLWNERLIFWGIHINYFIHNHMTDFICHCFDYISVKCCEDLKANPNIFHNSTTQYPLEKLLTKSQRFVYSCTGVKKKKNKNK